MTATCLSWETVASQPPNDGLRGWRSRAELTGDERRRWPMIGAWNDRGWHDEFLPRYRRIGDAYYVIRVSCHASPGLFRVAPESFALYAAAMRNDGPQGGWTTVALLRAPDTGSIGHAAACLARHTAAIALRDAP